MSNRISSGTSALAMAVTGVIAAGFLPSLAQAILPSVTFDLRVHDTGGKEATLAAVGDSVQLDLYAVSAGLNETSADDHISLGMGGFTSSTGGLLGDLQGLRPPAPYDSSGFNVGTSRDLDEDGDLDVGGPSGEYFFRVPPPPPDQPVGGQFVGRVKFTLRAAPSASDISTFTAVNYLLKPVFTSLLTYFDGSIHSTRWDPALMTVNYAAPVVIRGTGGFGGEATSLSGTYSTLTINSNSNVMPGNILTLTEGINVVAGGTLDSSGGGTADISINNATSGNSGGTLLVGPLMIGTTAPGTYTQSAGQSRFDTVTVGGGAHNANLVVAGGLLNTGAVTVGNNGLLRHTGGSSALASLNVGGGAGGAAVEMVDGELTVNGTATFGSGAMINVTGGLLALNSYIAVNAGSLIRMQGGTIAGTTFYDYGGRIEQTGGTLHGTITAGSVDGVAPSNYTITGGTFSGSSFGVVPGGSFVQEGGTIAPYSALVAINQSRYLLQNGNIQTPFLTVGTATDPGQPLTISPGTFTQLAGDVVAQELEIGWLSRYEVSAGTLTIGNSFLLNGTLDLSGAPIPVTFGTNCFADFTTGTLVGANNATFTGGVGSLMSFPAGFDPFAAIGSIQTQGLVHVAGQPLAVPAGKIIGGSGTIEGNVTNNGTISPGNSPGAIIVNGSYTQLSAAALQMEIAGRDAEEFDTLTVNGIANLDGLLSITLLDDFIPSAADSFTILTANSINGRFDNAYSAIEFLDGHFDVVYSSTAVTLTNFQSGVVPFPEPGSIAMLTAAFAAGLLRRCQRNGSSGTI